MYSSSSPSNGCCFLRFHYGPINVRLSCPTSTVGMKWACAMHQVSEAVNRKEDTSPTTDDKEKAEVAARQSRPFEGLVRQREIPVHAVRTMVGDERHGSRTSSGGVTWVCTTTWGVTSLDPRRFGVAEAQIL